MELFVKSSSASNVNIPGEYPGESVPPALENLFAAMLPVPLRVPDTWENVPMFAVIKSAIDTLAPIVTLELFVNNPFDINIPDVVDRSIWMLPLLSKADSFRIPWVPTG